MFFSKAELALDAFGRDENWRLATNGYRSHELVWSLFSDHEDRTRDFVFRWETDGELPILFVVSEREPEDPNNNFRRLQTKPFSPKLAEGQPLAFSLRANPVISKRDENGRQSVHDVVMDAKYKLREAGEWEESELTQAELAHREGISWLAKRKDNYGFVFDPEKIETSSYQRHEFRKSKNGRKVVIATIDFQGVLQVADPTRFTKSLFEGVGPSKAFGCGLLMVRPL